MDIWDSGSAERMASSKRDSHTRQKQLLGLSFLVGLCSLSLCADAKTRAASIRRPPHMWTAADVLAIDDFAHIQVRCSLLPRNPAAPFCCLLIEVLLCLLSSPITPIVILQALRAHMHSVGASAENLLSLWFALKDFSQLAERSALIKLLWTNVL